MFIYKTVARRFNTFNFTYNLPTDYMDKGSKTTSA